jgi:hypothetical protein
VNGRLIGASLRLFATVLAPYAELLGGELRIKDDCIERRGADNTAWASGGKKPHRLGAIAPERTPAGTELRIDFAYNRMLREYFAAKDLDFGSPDDLPPQLTLTLQYRDIEGRHHSKVLSFSLQPCLDTEMDRESGGRVVAIGMGRLLVADA